MNSYRGNLTAASGDGLDPALASAARTVRIEADSVLRLHAALQDSLGAPFLRAVDAIATSAGRVVVSGMGKSGLVGRKIAATLSSTGTPAFFLHPAEAGHGDLGMVTGDDLVLVLSWSGETSELKELVNYCTRFRVPIIALTATADSSLARIADIALILPAVQEACPNGLAPTSSTTLQIVLGDALAVALLERRGFSASDFQRFHPRGRLGAQLVTLADIMSIGEAVPRVTPVSTILEAAMEMTEKRFGATAITDADERLLGSFTDGDLRRSLNNATPSALVSDHMSPHPLRCEPTLLASEALALMNGRQISQLFVCRDERLVGIVHLHDILRAGVM